MGLDLPEWGSLTDFSEAGLQPAGTCRDELASPLFHTFRVRSRFLKPVGAADERIFGLYRDMTPRCVLEGLKPDRSRPAREGDAGLMQWCGSPNLPPRSGHWLVRQIDVQDEQPVTGS